MNRWNKLLLLLCTFLPSPLRLVVWRLLGHQVGRGCRVSFLSIVVAEHIELGPGAVIEPLTLVYCPRQFVMGERSRIAGFVRIIGYGSVELGPQTFVALGCLIDCTTAFHLGDRSQLGPRGIFYTHGASGLVFNMRYRHRNGAIHIGQDCWFGMACLVYPNVTVGDRVLVFPGMALSSAVDSDLAILPPEVTYRAVPVRLFQTPAASDVRLTLMENALRRWAARCPGSRVDDSHPDRLVLKLARDGEVVLFRGPPDGTPTGISGKRAIVWRLDEALESPSVPTFEFSSLRVRGGWTPLAERAASFLNEHWGTAFAFDELPDR